MDDTEKLWSLVDENPTCMMVTLDDTQEMDARPMNAAARPDDRTLLFYTRLTVGKTEDITETGKTCLCFSCPKTGHFVALTGHAAFEADRDLIRKHWSPFVDAWFPEGPEGDDVGMIRVTVERARYWDNESSQVLGAMKMLRASARNEIPDLADTGSVHLG